MTIPEALAKVREALKRAGREARNWNDNWESVYLDDALAALASLERTLAGDGDDDGKEIAEYIRIAEQNLLGCYDEQVSMSYAEIQETLSRLVAKAKLADGERKKIKRETLEDVFMTVTTSSGADAFQQRMTQWIHSEIEKIDCQIAELGGK